MMAGVLAALVSSGASTMALNATLHFGHLPRADNRRGDRRPAGRPLGRRFAYQFNLLIFGGACLRRRMRTLDDWLIVIRCIMGIGLGAEFVVGYGMISEFVPPQQRGRYTALLNLISSSGVFAVSLTGFAVIPWLGWRAMFIIGGIGALWVWWLRRSLPESPRWLETVGRHDEAEQRAATHRARGSTAAANCRLRSPIDSPDTAPRADLGAVLAPGDAPHAAGDGGQCHLSGRFLQLHRLDPVVLRQARIQRDALARLHRRDDRRNARRTRACGAPGRSHRPAARHHAGRAWAAP